MSELNHSPFSDLNKLIRSINRLDSTNLFDHFVESQIWSPTIDIKEDDSGLTIFADIPGVETSDIEITVEQNLLSISGDRSTEAAAEEGSYKRRERNSGRFLRQFSLPESADTDQISATTDKGVLQISIPKITSSGKQNIRVEDLD
jgi:HSP20 family protein